MKKILPILLIIGGLAVSYLGFTKLENNSKGIEIGNLEIKAQNKESSNTSYVMMGAGVLMIFGGFTWAGRK